VYVVVAAFSLAHLMPLESPVNKTRRHSNCPYGNKKKLTGADRCLGLNVGIDRGVDAVLGVTGAVRGRGIEQLRDGVHALGGLLDRFAQPLHLLRELGGLLGDGILRLFQLSELPLVPRGSASRVEVDAAAGLRVTGTHVRRARAGQLEHRGLPVVWTAWGIYRRWMTVGKNESRGKIDV